MSFKPYNYYENKVMFGNRPYFQGKDCDFCHKKLAEPFKLMEVRDTPFRGDDDVFAFHIECPFEVVKVDFGTDDETNNPNHPPTA